MKECHHNTATQSRRVLKKKSYLKLFSPIPQNADSFLMFMNLHPFIYLFILFGGGGWYNTKEKQFLLLIQELFIKLFFLKFFL